MDNRIDLTLQQRQAVEAELAKRTLAHKRRVGRIRRGAQLRAQRRAKAKKPKVSAPQQATQLDFLAIGDSWFDYPLDGNDPSLTNTAIAAQLAHIGNPPPLVLNYALYGQATTAVLTYENQSRIIDVASDPTQWLNGAPDAILVSMGGDDLVGDQFAIYLDYQGSGLDAARLQGALDSVSASYMDLFALRDAIAPGKPVIGHCYDYAIPNGAAPICAGPWLLPSLEFAGYDPAEGLNIVSAIIDRFYTTMQGLAAVPKNNFVLIDTRNTLARVAGAQNGWANELHPYPAGFMLLAQKWLTALRTQFPAGSI
ncbi:MAG: SGNH/GDSL hydrolase family protein [Roseiarcus sp.]|uniref:SGNH/GDSL hydrolase family protein n=1 Tax=Roseiarcus sp. TaxID=1969460 RepID=UPI003C322D90